MMSRPLTHFDWMVDRETVARPDPMVVCGEQPRQHLERPPAVVMDCSPLFE